MKADGDPNSIVYFGGQYVPMREAKVGILTHALHYGTGVFEGIRAYWNEDEQELFVLRAHGALRALEEELRDLAYQCAAVLRSCARSPTELVRRNEFRTDLYIRPLAYKSAERIGVAMDEQDAFAVVAIRFGEYLHSENGLHAGVSSWRRIDDNAIPPRAKICGAYANSALASDDAHRSGFDEAIFLNESGHVAEGATCNLFMLRKGRFVTPSATENVLEGITRQCVAELAQHELALEVVERPIDRSELYICDELFLTGTAVGLAPVTARRSSPSEGRNNWSGDACNTKTVFRCNRGGHLRAYRNWLTPVYQSRMKHEQELVSMVVWSMTELALLIHPLGK